MLSLAKNTNLLVMFLLELAFSPRSATGASPWARTGR